MAVPQNKVIITCAITGSIHTPTMSPALPITPSEIVEHSVMAADAGASIMHLHARDPQDGRPTAAPELFMEFLPRIKQHTEAVCNITTGGSLKMSLEERLAAPRRASPGDHRLVPSMDPMNAPLRARTKLGRPVSNERNSSS